jgi:phosphoribosylaminoimidazole (AIR) synthetase
MNTYDKEIVEPGDRFSKVAREICVDSFNNCSALNVIRGGDGMRTMDGFVWNKPILEAMLRGEIYEVSQSDGAGGKPQFFTLNNTPGAFRELIWEVITMNADDLACRGGFPALMLSSNIDVKGITDENWHLCKALLKGMGPALSKSKLVMMTGETAIMKHSITAFCDTGSKEQLILTWGATSHGLASTSKKPNGSTIEPGMKIIGLKDDGYRCNGGTKFTNLIKDFYGYDSTSILNHEIRDFVEKLVVPSKSYARLITKLNGWSDDGTFGKPITDLYGVAHITGGGVWSKLGEILPDGVGANLDGMPMPADVLLQAQEMSLKTDDHMTDHECYGTFHGGCGMMIICSQYDADKVMYHAYDNNYSPHIIGETITSELNEILINSRFKSGRFISSLDLK